MAWRRSGDKPLSEPFCFFLSTNYTSSSSVTCTSMHDWAFMNLHSATDLSQLVTKPTCKLMRSSSKTESAESYPDSKVRGANMGPIWRWAPCWPHELCYLGNSINSLSKLEFHYSLVAMVAFKFSNSLILLAKFSLIVLKYSISPFMISGCLFCAYSMLVVFMLLIFSFSSLFVIVLCATFLSPELLVLLA